jgi:S1-C subfamily serine protease
MLLGARASRPSPALDAQLELRGRGVVIEAVEKDTLADRLGLARFDILVELNGREIHGFEDVAAALQGLPDGAKVSAKVVRRAQQLTLTDEGRAAPK